MSRGRGRPPGHVDATFARIDLVPATLGLSTSTAAMVVPTMVNNEGCENSTLTGLCTNYAVPSFKYSTDGFLVGKPLG